MRASSEGQAAWRSGSVAKDTRGVVQGAWGDEAAGKRFGCLSPECWHGAPFVRCAAGAGGGLSPQDVHTDRCNVGLTCTST